MHEYDPRLVSTTRDQTPSLKFPLLSIHLLCGCSTIMSLLLVFSVALSADVTGQATRPYQSMNGSAILVSDIWDRFASRANSTDLCTLNRGNAPTETDWHGAKREASEHMSTRKTEDIVARWYSG